MAASSLPAVVKVGRLTGGPMETPDPFLFAVYHKDMYPAGDAKMQAPIRGDGAHFDPDAPFRMYHGDRVPGFPQHPHRGFETITYVMEGIVDHTDSAGNAGRYGNTDGSGYGDCQWLTAGRGVVHGEMFPLVNTDTPNTLRLMQIWLNLPKKNKMAPPAFKMGWAENMKTVEGVAGAHAVVVVGKLGDVVGNTAPEHSWGADPANDVGVFYIRLPAGGSRFTLPPAAGGAAINRQAYVLEGKAVTVGGTNISGTANIQLRAEAEVDFVNKHPEAGVQVLILQGRPIGEPVAQRGPFVMNTQEEIMQAYADYRRTQFGGWPWPEDAMVFPRTTGRFASRGKEVELPPNTGGATDAAASSS